jgi:rubrerythrin
MRINRVVSTAEYKELRQDSRFMIVYGFLNVTESLCGYCDQVSANPGYCPSCGATDSRHPMVGVIDNEALYLNEAL